MMGNLAKVTARIRTFEARIDVSGFLEGSINDWPANVQDKVFEAVENLSFKHQLPLKIVMSRCEVDHGEAMDGSKDTFFLHVVASEVVMADSNWVEERERINYNLRQSIYGSIQ